MPRLGFSEGAVGGAVKRAKPDCDSENKNHPCSGSPDCGLIPTTIKTTNHATQYFIEGTEVNDCKIPGLSIECIGKASAPNPDCIH
jgi:hypothetical protein